MQLFQFAISANELCIFTWTIRNVALIKSIIIIRHYCFWYFFLCQSSPMEGNKHYVDAGWTKGKIACNFVFCNNRKESVGQEQGTTLNWISLFIATGKNSMNDWFYLQLRHAYYYADMFTCVSVAWVDHVHYFCTQKTLRSIFTCGL
jgi:hypothetical protein